MTEHAPDLSATEARQGLRGRHVLVILVTSTLLVVIAFVVIFMANSGRLAGRHGNREAPPNVARSIAEEPNAVTRPGATAPQGSVASQATRSPDQVQPGGG